MESVEQSINHSGRSYRVRWWRLLLLLVLMLAVGWMFSPILELPFRAIVHRL